ncbi:MAG: RDD family protein [Bacilli bacterium]|nr:RDD family protein [Bacilli bacterium]
MDNIETKKPKEMEYFKAPFGKRLISIILEVVFLSFGTFAFLFLSRMVVESMPAYTSAFETYISISKDSGLYVCDDTTDENLVPLTEYYEKKTNEEQNAIIEGVLTDFYSKEQFFPQDITSDDYGPTIYYNQKIGDNRIGAKDDKLYFVKDAENNAVANPSYSQETMHEFYLQAYDRAVGYIKNAEGFVEARNVLTIYINLILIPLSISLSFAVFEIAIPLIFGNRGKQTISMKLLKLSLLTPKAVSPKAGNFIVRQMIQLVVEMLLSMVTLGVPLIVSFSFMVFRKDGQCLHDYLSATYMVDTSEQSVYNSPEEMAKLQAKAAKTESESFLGLSEDDPNRPLGTKSIWNDLK